MKRWIRVHPVTILAAWTVNAFVAGTAVAQAQPAAEPGRAGGPLAPPPAPPGLAWAFPLAPPGLQRETDDGVPKNVPGSTVSLTITQINNQLGPADWFPDEHPPMPGIVGHGRQAQGGNIMACSLCHLPNGLGHPESSALAGLSAAYIVQDMLDWRSGARTVLGGVGGIMATFAKNASDAEIHEAANYFASLKPVKWTRVVESATVPRSVIGVGNMRFRDKSGGTEPLGRRIIELPEDDVQASLRDSHSGFVAYVPVGSVRKGEALVDGGRVKAGKVTSGRTIQCNICHGADLKGLGFAPALAGRSPIYVVRQLYLFQQDNRKGPFADFMKETVSRLTDDDMLSIAAYLGSLPP